MTQPDTVTEPKKERQRSPNYPAVGLREAVDRVKRLYEADGKAGAPAEIAAKHIGYSSAHGQAMSVLAALKKFGLVSEGNGRLMPSQRAIEIINLPEVDPRRATALREAALNPAAYLEIVESHKETGLPGNDVLEADLITYKNFNPKAVAGFVRDFRDTLEYAGIDVKDVLDSSQMTTTANNTQTGTDRNNLNNKGNQSDFSSIFQGGGGAITRKYPVDISIPRGLKAELAISGDFKQEDLERLKKQINRVIENLEDAFLD